MTPWTMATWRYLELSHLRPLAYITSLPFWHVCVKILFKALLFKRTDC